MANAASAGLVRAINDRLALDLIVELGPLSRAQLVRETGLSKQTVVELLDRLMAAGLVTEAGVGGHGTRGPSARIYGVVSTVAYVLGAEVRRTEVTAQVADIAGHVVGSSQASVNPGHMSIEVVRRTLARAVAAVGAGELDLRAIVLGTPGIVDPETGDLGFAWDLPDWFAGLPQVLAEELGAPATLENEVNLAALAEHRTGAARDREDFALIEMGAGIGMATVLAGRLHRGCRGAAGEIGYIPAPEFPVIGRSQTGNSYEGGLQGAIGDAALLKLAGVHGIEADSAAAAIELAPDGGAFLSEVAARTASGIIAICAVLDPGVVVLAGATGRAIGSRIGADIGAMVAAATPLRVEVRPGEVKGNAVVVGALTTALDSAREEVFGSGTTYVGQSSRPLTLS